MSKNLITILMACRVKGNTNSDLINSLRSFIDNAYDKNSFEILIKFDDDDEQAKLVSAEVEKLPIKTKFIFTPRGKGYADLHKGYYDLFLLANETSEIFWSISDDLKMETKDWDKLLIDAFNKHKGKTFVLHAAKLKNIVFSNINHSVESVDCYPLWTRKWLCSAGFGYTFSTDGWTSLLEYILFRDYGIDNRIYVDGIKYNRKIDEAIDGVNSPRYNNERRQMTDLVKNPNFVRIAEETAATIAAKILREGKIVKLSFRSIRHKFLRLFRSKKG